MTAVAASEVLPAREATSLARRMHGAYLEATLFTLVKLEEVTRETNLLDARGSVVAYERSARHQAELREWVDRYKTIVQLLEDEGLV
jgi:hypothetical protein